MSSQHSRIGAAAVPALKSLLAAAAGFVVCLGAGLLLVPSTGLVNGFVLLAAFAACAAGAGMLLGRIFGSGYANSIGVGAMLALLLLWIPVVFVTYGFAIAGIPILVAYAYCFVLGARWSGPWRRRAAQNNGP